MIIIMMNFNRKVLRRESLASNGVLGVSNGTCSNGICSKALIACSMATYCYSLPMQVEIENETDLRKYVIRLSFAV